MGEQVLCGLFHGAGVKQGLHGMFSGEAHVHQLKQHKKQEATFNKKKKKISNNERSIRQGKGVLEKRMIIIIIKIGLMSCMHMP